MWKGNGQRPTWTCTVLPEWGGERQTFRCLRWMEQLPGACASLVCVYHRCAPKREISQNQPCNRLPRSWLNNNYKLLHGFGLLNGASENNLPKTCAPLSTCFRRSPQCVGMRGGNRQAPADSPKTTCQSTVPCGMWVASNQKSNGQEPARNLCDAFRWCLYRTNKLPKTV